MTANATIYSGDSKTLEITITNADSEPVALLGATMRYVIASNPSEPAQVTKTVGDGISIGGDDNNVAIVTLIPADTEALSGTYQHELEITDSGGNVSTSMQGVLTILKDNVA